MLRGGEVMELWAMVVQYACAAAGAAAVVRLVDGCGKGAKKKNAPEVELGSVQKVQGATPCENNTSITDFLTFARGEREFGKKN